MSGPICANCKYWGAHYGVWADESLKLFNPCNNPELLAVGLGDGVTVPVETHPDFGCNQFEAGS